MLKRTIYCFIRRKSDVLLCHYWELVSLALEIQEELLRSVGGRKIGFAILDFMDVVIARGWATDHGFHAVEPQLLEENVAADREKPRSLHPLWKEFLSWRTWKIGSWRSCTVVATCCTFVERSRFVSFEPLWSLGLCKIFMAIDAFRAWKTEAFSDSFAYCHSPLLRG